MLADILLNYRFEECVDTVERIKGGNVNETYCITLSGGKKYVVQKINGKVFKNPKEVMANQIAIKRYLAGFYAESQYADEETFKIKRKRTTNEKILDKTSVVDIKLTKYGEPFCVINGEVWRVCPFVKSYCGDKLKKTDCLAIERTGNAFGCYVKLLDKSRIALYDVIKDFHSPKKRCRDLFSSVDGAPLSRLKKSKSLLERLKEKIGFINELANENERNEKRIVHNDCKADNVIFAKEERNVIIDLDTTMYGYLSYDFGDGARSACSVCSEDEKDLSKVDFSLEYFKAFTRGYLGVLKGVITDEERKCCVFSPELIALELSARFLTDYLNGDVYFLTEYTEHNLVRAECQFALASKMYEKRDLIEKIVLNV